jgi:ribosome-binding factor A
MKKRPDKARPTGPSQRQLRVGEELRHALAEILPRAHLRDPDLQGVSLTVSEVRASPDLKYATAYVVPLGGRDADTVVKALNRAASYLRGHVARRVQLRAAPEIDFAVDRSFDNATRIDAVLRRPEVQRDLVAEPDDDGEAQR